MDEQKTARSFARPLSPQDLYEFTWVNDPQISPDGLRVAYVVTKPERNGKRNATEIWVAPLSPQAEGTAIVVGKTRRFTSGPRDRAPRWSPDGKRLAFITDRGDGTQIWLMRAAGGEAQPLTRLSGGVGGEPVWSPDGSNIAFLRRLPLEAPAAAPANGARPASDVKAFTRLHYKENGRGLWDGKYSQVWVAPVNGGEPRQVTSGAYDHGMPAWSPDGSEIALTANRAADPDRTPTADVWVVPANGGEPRRVTRSTGPVALPAWSPDGTVIAYYGHRNEHRGATDTHVFVVPADGSAAPVDILAGHELDAGSGTGSDMMSATMPAPTWSPDGKSIMFTACARGACDLYLAYVPGTGSLDGTPKPARLTTGRHAVYGLTLANDRRRAALAVGCQTSPGDIFVTELAAGGGPAAALTPVTDVHAWLRDRLVIEPEEFSATGPDGGEVHGWLIKPAGINPGELRPLVLQVHGGPHAAYGYGFFHEMQVLAGMGMGVVYCNPAGSTGYGQEFVTLTRLDWGGRDFRDVLAAVDHALAQGWADPARVGITGGSYGGYLTNWAVGQTKRFAAAVTCRSTCNRYSQFGTSDIGYYNGDYEFSGNPWDNPDGYMSRSPITYVNNVETPLLFIHSENDLRCPMEQAEQYYTALKWLGKTTELVRFPDENHELSRSGQPVHRVERIERITAWFARYLGRK